MSDSYQQRMSEIIRNLVPAGDPAGGYTGYVARHGSPLAPAANNTGYENEARALAYLQSQIPQSSPLEGSNTATTGMDKGNPGAPATGNVGRDAAAAMGAIGQQAMGIAANPVGMVASVPATMAAAAINAIAGIPTQQMALSEVMGVRGLTNAIRNAVSQVAPAVDEVETVGSEAKGDKPDSLDAAGAAAAAASPGQDKGETAGTADSGKGDAGTGPADGGSKGDASGNAGPGGDDAGYARGGIVTLANGGRIVQGPGSGLDDLIPTTIDGKQAAALSDGEFVIPADVVSMMGDGSTSAGSRRLYDLISQIRQEKTGTTQQAGPLPVGDILKRTLR